MFNHIGKTGHLYLIEIDLKNSKIKRIIAKM